MRKTSMDAFNALVMSGGLTKARAKTYSIIFNNGPLTQTEAEQIDFDRTGKKSHCHKRFSELERQGVIEAVGERKSGATGNSGILWDVTDRSVPLPLKTQRTTRKQLEAEIDKLTRQNNLFTYEILRLRGLTNEATV